MTNLPDSPRPTVGHSTAPKHQSPRRMYRIDLINAALGDPIDAAWRDVVAVYRRAWGADAARDPRTVARIIQVCAS